MLTKRQHQSNMKGLHTDNIASFKIHFEIRFHFNIKFPFESSSCVVRQKSKGSFYNGEITFHHSRTTFHFFANGFKSFM